MTHPAPAPPPAPSAEPALGRAAAGLLLATVFASGAAVMILEMTAVRAVQPFFGSTTYVWTNVIAVVLAALAVGYALGGRLADRRPSPTLLYALLGLGGLLVALAALSTTPVSRLFLQEGLDLEGVVSVLLWGSLGTAVALFAPPILLLGAVTPMAIRLLAGRGVGHAAGSVFAVSTVGSIVGTYLPTLVLVPRFGSRGTMLVAAAILLVASAAGLLGFARRWKRAASLLLLLGAGTTLATALAGGVVPAREAPPLGEGVARVLEEIESPYQYLAVREDTYPDGTNLVLTINEGVYASHALKAPGRVLTGSPFYDAYAVLPLLLDLEPGDAFCACVVGLACGVGAAQWHHLFSAAYDVEVDGAELDPAVIRLGRRYFELPDSEAGWLRVYAMDGRSLLACAPPEVRYHAIAVDAFANELYVPFHLATVEFFTLCHERLEDGGVLAMNVYARGTGAPNLAAIENTMAAVFGSALRVPQHVTGGFLLLARRGEAAVDLTRLDPAAIGHRVAAWERARDWQAPSEWEELLALAEGVRTRGQTRGVRIEPRKEAPILTDDDAPLEWLTDRFLWQSEAERFGAGDARSRALAALRGRQDRLLLLLAAAWGTGLLLAFGLARRPRDPTGA